MKKFVLIMAMLCPIISVAQNSVTDTLSIKETLDSANFQKFLRKSVIS